MPLYDNPPFTVTIYALKTSQDDGGGTQNDYSTVRAANVAGILNSTSSSEKEMFAQMGMTVDATFVQYGTTAAQRGDKLVYNGNSYHIRGINSNDAMGNIPALSTLYLELIL